MRRHLQWAEGADLQGQPREPARPGDPELDGCRAPRVGLVVGIDTGGTFTDLVVLDTATGRIESLKTSSTAELARHGDRERARRGRRAGRRARGVHPRHDGRDERADRADRLPGRVRDDRRLRGHAVHPADQPQGALRPAVAQAGAARREPAPLPRGRRAAERGRRDAAAGRPGAGAGALPHDPRRRAPRRSRSRSSSRTSTPATRSAVKAILARGAAGSPRLGLERGGADLARVRARLDDDRGRLPAPAVRPLRRRASTRRCAAPGCRATGRS